MQAKQMRDMPDHELEEQIADYRKDLLDMRLSNATGELDDTARLGRTRRDLALGELQPRRVLERAGDRLEAQVEQLPPPLREPIAQLVVAQIP